MFRNREDEHRMQQLSNKYDSIVLHWRVFSSTKFDKKFTRCWNVPPSEIEQLGLVNQSFQSAPVHSQGRIKVLLKRFLSILQIGFEETLVYSWYCRRFFFSPNTDDIRLVIVA